MKLLKEKGKCCITGKPMSDCKQVNFIQVNMKALWKFPTWGNILTGKSNMAMAIVHDECIVDGKLSGEVKHVIEVRGEDIFYHHVELEWDIIKQGIDTKDFTPQNVERLEKIRCNCLSLFQQSHGWRFIIKGTHIVDEVQSVDFEKQMVKGKHGDYHIDVCQIAGMGQRPDRKDPVVSNASEDRPE